MISNIAQINTFIAGMDCDTDVNLLPGNSYRYAENVRVITNDGGTTGVLLNIEGVKKYTTYIPDGETIVGTTTINDIAVIVTRLTENGKNITKLYKVTGFDTSSPVQKLIVQGELGICEDLENTPNISIVANYETDLNIKVYFTDGLSSIKMINIGEGNDDKYNSNNNLIDANGYIINPKALDITPGATLPPFELQSLTVGNLPSGTILYCYQLFNLHGQESTLSPLSNIIHLTQSSTNQGSLSYQGSYPNTSSLKGCIVKAPLITKDFEKCRVISIRYSSNNSIPLIIIVDEIDIAPNLDYIEYADTGNAYMGEITIDEFNNLTGYQFFALNITKLQNRLFASNIQEESWNPEYDARAYRCNSSGIAVLKSGNSTEDYIITDLGSNELNVPENHDCINPYNNTDFYSATLSQKYIFGKAVNGTRRLGGYGNNIEYHFVTVPILLSDLLGQDRLNNDCSMNVSALNMSDITVTHVGYNSQTTVDLNDNVLLRTPNYSDPTISSKFKGYQRDEIYRFGIIFYNQKGIPSPVKWIADIRMPHATELPIFEYKLVNGESRKRLVGNALGISFTVKNIPDGVTSYEIVRCDRTESDRTILMLTAMSNVYAYMINETGDMVGEGDILETSLQMRPSFTQLYYNDVLLTSTFGHNTVNGKDWAPMYFKDVDIYATTAWLFYIVTSLNCWYANDYARLVSPEISVLNKEIEKYFDGTAYIECIGKYGTPIYTADTTSDSSKARAFATVEKVLQSDGDIDTVKMVDGSNNLVLIALGVSNVYDEFLNDYILMFQTYGYIANSLVQTDETYYHGNISKFYYPHYEAHQSVLLNDAKYAMDIEYNRYTDVKPYSVNVGEISYINWAMTCFNKANEQTTTGAAGPCVVVHAPGLNNSVPRVSTTDSYSDSYIKTADKPFFIPICNIKKVTNMSYGGNTHTSRLNSVYISTNSYQLIDQNTSYTNLVYNGDTFLNVLDYPCLFTFQHNDEKVDAARRRFIGAYIPFESSINMNLFNGDMAHRSRTNEDYVDTHLQLEPTQKGLYHIQDRPYYVYNTTYSTLTGSRKFVPNSIYAEDNIRTANRIMASEAKTSNEVIDSWTTFKIANYLDVDNQYGGITNLKVFKDRLFYWLPTALGIAAVNERSLITDDNINLLVLGTGEILSRFDYVTTTNGSSVINDRSIVNSDELMYWYDYDKNEICSYNGAVVSLSKNGRVLSYLNEMYSAMRDCTLGMYDKKYNEIWFRFYDKSLIFNEQINKFTSFYTFNPDWALSFSNKTVGIKDNKYYTLNTLDTDTLDTVDKISKVTFVVNDNSQSTKVFDNILIQGVFKDENGALKTSNIINGLRFETKNLVATLNNSVVFDYREDTFRLPVPREDEFNDPMSFPARMRGKYMICSYEFDSDNEHTFEIPLIITTYRYSQV